MSEKSVEIPLLMTRHYPDLDSSSDWLKQICHVAGPNQKHYPYLGGDTSSVWPLVCNTIVPLYSLKAILKPQRRRV